MQNRPMITLGFVSASSGVSASGDDAGTMFARPKKKNHGPMSLPMKWPHTP